MLRGSHTYMCCLRVQNNKNCFARDRTTQAVVQAKPPNVHTIKIRTFTVQHRFYFFYVSHTKKVYVV